MITSARFVSELMRVDDENDDEDEPRVVAPSLVLSVTALPLVVVAHETMSRAIYSDHHAVAGVEAVLSDVLIPLLGGRFAAESKPDDVDDDIDDDNGLGDVVDGETSANARVSQTAAVGVESSALSVSGGAAGRLPSARPPTRRVRAPPSRPASPALPIAEATDKEKLQANIFRVALKSNAVWRIVRAYVSVSVMSLRAPRSRDARGEETEQLSTFQAISKRHERSPREAEIERVRDVLKAAIKLSEKSLSTERREADRALSDAVAPLPADALGLDDDASYDLGPRWGDAESAKALTPSAFFVEENASERERTLLIAATRFLAIAPSRQSAIRFRREVSARTAQIQAAITFLLEPGSHHNATNTSKHSHFTSALRSLSQTLGDRAELPNADSVAAQRRSRRRR